MALFRNFSNQMQVQEVPLGTAPAGGGGGLSLNGSNNLDISSYNQGFYIGNAYYATSDYRIKENVQQFYDTVDGLNPVKYLNTKQQRTEFGFIAHELQNEFPELVSGEKDGEYLQSINYQGLIAVLVKGLRRRRRRTLTGDT